MADLKIVIETPSKDLTVVRLSGEFEGHNVLDRKDGLLEELKHSSSSHWMVDFSEIEYIDSAAIGALLEMMKLAENQKKSFGLLHVNTEVMKVLQVTKLDKILKIYK